LRACCEAAGVVLDSAHSALHDARATARLFAHYVTFGVPEAEPAPDLSLDGDVAEVRRGVARTVGRHAEPVALVRGDRVVFTGQMHAPRDVWIDRAAECGLVSQGYVTKATRLLVAADPFTLSGKARRARAYRVPIVSEDDFAGMLDGLGVTAVAKDHRTEWPRAY
jgi:DNA polymerase III subunit epsilon